MVETVEHIKRHRESAVRLAALAECDAPRVVARLNPDDPQKYEKASHLLFTVITRDFPEDRFRSGGVIRGFNVSFWLAAWGLRAYKVYADRMNASGNLPELGEILSNSYESTVTTFSSTTNTKNKVLEMAFGLNAFLSPAFEPVPFRISDTNDQRVLVPSEVTLSLAGLEPEFDAVDEVATVGRCPASGKMLRKIWAATIETCISSDALFPHDLAQHP